MYWWDNNLLLISWTAVSGLLALIRRAYSNFSLWHHEFIKANRSASLVILKCKPSANCACAVPLMAGLGYLPLVAR